MQQYHPEGFTRLRFRPDTLRRKVNRGRFETRRETLRQEARTQFGPRSEHWFHCNFAYSALACRRTGIPGSASFHSVRKSW